MSCTLEKKKNYCCIVKLNAVHDTLDFLCHSAKNENKIKFLNS